jgi:hypothetical protein
MSVRHADIESQKLAEQRRWILRQMNIDERVGSRAGRQPLSHHDDGQWVYVAGDKQRQLDHGQPGERDGPRKRQLRGGG